MSNVRPITTSRILIVDDEPDNLSLLQNLFSYFKADVYIARSGQACMALLADTFFDLVLLDIQMPGVSGESTLRAIRRHPEANKRAIPVIAVTALAMDGDRERLLAAGFDAYVPKPIDVQLMLHIAQQHLVAANV